MDKDSSLEKKIDALTKLTKMLVNGFAALEGRIDRGFTAVAEDITDLKGEIVEIKRTMATKEDVFTLQTQNNSIESELRGMKYVKLQGRVADLEEEAFGEIRA